jgi:chemotaxis protein CheC
VTMKGETMELNPEQKDALTELVNIGFGKAANALSILVGKRVILDTPEVNIYTVEKLADSLSLLAQREMTTVHQLFSGKLAGDIMLIMDLESSTILLDLLQGGPGSPHPLTDDDRDSLVEIGNILLNAFIGSFGNLLNVRISFAVPRLSLESIHHMVDTLTIDQRNINYAMVVKIFFRLTEGEVSGFMVIVMGIESMEALLSALESEGYLR